MPAFRTLTALNLILAISTTMMVGPVFAEPASQSSESETVALTKALSWLASNQYSNGSYGAYSQIQTAPAAYAFWLNDSDSTRARASYSWLASEFDDETSGIWSEAGTPGEMLYTLAISDNLHLLTYSLEDYRRLLTFQQASGGFRGFWVQVEGEWVQVETSVDTAMAILGLISAGVMPSSWQELAVDYLLSLQNNDGSFNLTHNIAASEYSSLGPELVSMTALATIALGYASYAVSDINVSRALSYLSHIASENFSGHVYAAALSALAFKAFGRSADASKAVSFILSSQNDDGGFRDKSRTSLGSNALDTGWGAIALHLVQPEPSRSPALNPLVLSVLVASVAIPLVAILGGVVYFRRRKRKVLTPA